MRRYPFLIVGAIVGLILGMTNLLAPIHELYHYITAASQGIDANITSWNTTTLSQFNGPALFAGWSSNLWFGVLWAIIFAVIGRQRGSWLTGAGGWAYALAGWGRAFGSWDFNGAIKAYVATVTSDPALQASGWAEIHRQVTLRWALLGGFLLCFALALVLLMARDKKKPGQGPAVP